VIDAQEAYRIGLVTKVVPADQLLAEAEKLLRTILANAPIAVALTIAAVHEGSEMPLADGLKKEADLFGVVAATEDAREGTSAFLEKRSPTFRGK